MSTTAGVFREFRQRIGELEREVDCLKITSNRQHNQIVATIGAVLLAAPDLDPAVRESMERLLVEEQIAQPE